MAIQHLDYWYDRQIPRFLEQIVRAFSGFQYMTGWRNGTEPQLKMVPCRLASRDRLVSSIIRNNSENVLNTVPMITIDHTGLSYRSPDLQSPTHVDTQNIVERKIDPQTGLYTGEKGNSYTVERLMPRPMMMTVQIDIWTSNMEQKYQLIEQLATTMYPFVEIQNSESAIDWTAKTTMTLDEEISWTNRSLPIGTDSEIEITTITAKIPFWLTPPAKVHQQRRIEQIVTNMRSTNRIEQIGTDISENDTLIARQITTPGNHWIEVKDGTLRLLGPENGDPETVYSWAKLLSQYGDISPTESEIRIKKIHDVESDQEIIGTIQFDSNNPNILFWQIDPDTLPANTISPVNAVINPLNTFPGNGLPGPVQGQRYLLVSDLGNSSAWGALTAKADDIIEYQNGAWGVVFNAQNVTSVHFVLNMTSSKQLRWDGEWSLAVDGSYAPGYWRLRI